MKKFLCAILTSALLLTSVTPAFAAGSIDVPESKISEIVTEFCKYMPEDPGQRIRIWMVFKAYMVDGTNGIDTIIAALKGEQDLPANDDMQIIFNKFVDQVKDKYSDQFIFLLELYKNTSLSARKESLDNFGKDPVNGVFEKTPLELNAEEKAAADALFDAYITDDAETGLDFHEIDSANFLNLITPFNGRFKMTNDRNDDFVLSTYSKTFAKDLGSTLEYSSINGVDVESRGTDLQKGFDILTGVVEMFNSFSDEQKDNLKIVLANEDINLYKEGQSAAERPADEEDPDDTDDTDPTRPGGGSTRPNRPGTSTGDEFVLTTPTYNTSKPLFNDMTSGSWEVPYVMNLTERKIFIGYEDGSFRPNISISRQEIAVALVRAMGLSPDAAMADANSGFSDDATIADWARGYVNIAVEKKLFTGYDDGEFKPTRTISRQELITVIMRLTEDSDASTSMTYTDAADIQGYAREYVGKATNLGILGGYPDGSFKPFNDVTRAEAAKMLYNGLEYYTFMSE